MVFSGLPSTPRFCHINIHDIMQNKYTHLISNIKHTQYNTKQEGCMCRS